MTLTMAASSLRLPAARGLQRSPPKANKAERARIALYLPGMIRRHRRPMRLITWRLAQRLSPSPKVDSTAGHHTSVRRVIRLPTPPVFLFLPPSRRAAKTSTTPHHQRADCQDQARALQQLRRPGRSSSSGIHRLLSFRRRSPIVRPRHFHLQHTRTDLPLIFLDPRLPKECRRLLCLLDLDDGRAKGDQRQEGLME